MAEQGQDPTPAPAPAPRRRRRGRAFWIAAAGLLTTFGAVSVVALFSTVTQYDAVARLQLVDPAGAVIDARPADLYAIKDQGRSISGPLCPSREGLQLRSATEHYEFSNVLGDYLPLLLAINESLWEPDLSHATSRLSWDAVVEYLPVSEINAAVTSGIRSNPDCQKIVETRINGGYRVCAIQKVFAKQDRRSIYAISFERCLTFCPENETCDESMKASDFGSLPIPIRIKHWLGLINYEKGQH